MERCPTCNAKYKGKTKCHRCKTDLSMLLDIEKKAQEHKNKAVEAFTAKDFSNMFLHAKRSFDLRQTMEAKKLLACASLFNKKFGLAVSLLNP